MRVLVLALLTLPALLPAGASAQATLNKCIDTQGRVTYSNLPCRDAREARTVEIDPAPPSVSSTRPAAAAKPPSRAAEPAPIKIETRNTTGKPVSRASANQCSALSDKLGRVFDKMDLARRKGYTQKQMDEWNQEVKALERQKQQSGCF